MSDHRSLPRVVHLTFAQVPSLLVLTLHVLSCCNHLGGGANHSMQHVHTHWSSFAIQALPWACDETFAETLKPLTSSAFGPPAGDLSYTNGHLPIFVQAS